MFHSVATCMLARDPSDRVCRVIFVTFVSAEGSNINLKASRLGLPVSHRSSNVIAM